MFAMWNVCFYVFLYTDTCTQRITISGSVHIYLYKEYTFFFENFYACSPDLDHLNLHDGYFLSHSLSHSVPRFLLLTSIFVFTSKDTRDNASSLWTLHTAQHH